MNERIENCLYQAGLTAQGCWDELDDYAREGIEKFARLIVRECADIGNKAYSDIGDYTYIGDRIKAHFGVKE